MYPEYFDMDEYDRDKEDDRDKAMDKDDLTIFDNKTGLADDMKFLASMPELCDVTFLVGDTREPVCAVKAVLAARSRVFQKMLYQVSETQKVVLWKISP